MLAVAINFGNDLLLRNPDDPVALWFTGIAMAPTVEWGNLGQARCFGPRTPASSG